MTSAVAQALPLLDAWTAHSVMQQRVPSVALAVVHGGRPVWTKRRAGGEDRRSQYQRAAALKV